MRLKPYASGIVSFIPGVNRFCCTETGGTDSARYCYSVWLRHLVMAARNALDTDPQVVAELGPGDSIGIGLAALMSGARKYYAFDVVKYVILKRNLSIFDEIVNLFKNRTNIPGEREFPEAKPFLDNYEFPGHILTDNRLSAALEANRIAKVRQSILNPPDDESPIGYWAPWYEMSIIKRESIDLIYSQAVLEHVDDLHNAYRAMRCWLRPGGYVSHQIDFTSHATADTWNGHWTYSECAWKLIRGRRPYLLNRQPHSIHIRILREEGFEIVCDKTMKSKSGIPRKRLARGFQNLSDDDLTTSAAFIQAIRRTDQNPRTATPASVASMQTGRLCVARGNGMLDSGESLWRRIRRYGDGS